MQNSDFLYTIENGGWIRYLNGMEECIIKIIYKNTGNGKIRTITLLAYYYSTESKPEEFLTLINIHGHYFEDEPDDCAIKAIIREAAYSIKYPESFGTTDRSFFEDCETFCDFHFDKVREYELDYKPPRKLYDYDGETSAYFTKCRKAEIISARKFEPIIKYGVEDLFLNKKVRDSCSIFFDNCVTINLFKEFGNGFIFAIYIDIYIDEQKNTAIVDVNMNDTKYIFDDAHIIIHSRTFGDIILFKYAEMLKAFADILTELKTRYPDCKKILFTQYRCNHILRYLECGSGLYENEYIKEYFTSSK